MHACGLMCTDALRISEDSHRLVFRQSSVQAKAFQRAIPAGIAAVGDGKLVLFSQKSRHRQNEVLPTSEIIYGMRFPSHYTYFDSEDVARRSR